MLKLVYTPSDSALATRLESELKSAGYSFTDGSPVLIPILSPAALNDQAVNDAIVAALDAGQQITPVIAAPLQIPRLIDHLSLADFTEGKDDFATLKANIDAALSPEARLPMRVLTPSRQKMNRSAGIVVAVIALGMFLVGLYAVGVLGIQMPQDEYNAVDTEAAMTRDPILIPILGTYSRFFPRSTDEATVFPSTLERIPTVYRPLIARTVTALALPSPTPLPPTETPEPGVTEEVQPVVTARPTTGG